MVLQHLPHGVLVLEADEAATLLHVHVLDLPVVPEVVPHVLLRVPLMAHLDAADEDSIPINDRTPLLTGTATAVLTVVVVGAAAAAFIATAAARGGKLLVPSLAPAVACCRRSGTFSCII